VKIKLAELGTGNAAGAAAAAPRSDTGETLKRKLAGADANAADSGGERKTYALRENYEVD
jgi:hypothetical protein